MKDTNELFNEIQKTKNFETFLENNKDEMVSNNLSECLTKLIRVKNKSKAEVVKKSNLNRSYAYQIFSGEKKHPGRDKVIALCIGLELCIEETQSLLKSTGYRELYARDPKDAIVIYSLENSYDIIATNSLLDENKFPIFQ